MPETSEIKVEKKWQLFCFLSNLDSCSNVVYRLQYDRGSSQAQDIALARQRWQHFKGQEDKESENEESKKGSKDR